MPLVNIDHHTNVYYEVSGHGQPVVLISGYRCDHTAWNLVRVKLASYFQTLVFDIMSQVYKFLR